MKPEKAKKSIKKTIKKKSSEQYEQQIGELTAHLQRLQAEFENYKKRVNDERSELMSSAKEAVLSELLPALDNFDRAAMHLPSDLEDNNWAKGMQYVGQQMLDILDGMGVQRFSPEGEEFDHSKHEAIEYVPSDKPEGIITEVIIPGYQIAERVVRPAQVKVSSGQHKLELDELNIKKGEK
jgi:molecular chaperone GrpE